VNFLKKINTSAATLLGQFHFPAIFHTALGQSQRITAPPIRKASKPAVKPVQHKSISKKPKPIRLVGLEEHRCPYCLELVEENDPAGVVVCPICHANHHKSCWDISGTCQVPHIQS
jgi:ribosomal protein L37AE/L43A